MDGQKSVFVETYTCCHSIVGGVTIEIINRPPIRVCYGCCSGEKSVFFVKCLTDQTSFSPGIGCRWLWRILSRALGVRWFFTYPTRAGGAHRLYYVLVSCRRQGRVGGIKGGKHKKKNRTKIAGAPQDVILGKGGKRYTVDWRRQTADVVFSPVISHRGVFIFEILIHYLDGQFGFISLAPTLNHIVKIRENRARNFREIAFSKSGQLLPSFAYVG